MQQQQQPSTSNIIFLPHQQVPQQQQPNTAVTLGSQQRMPTTTQQQQFGAGAAQTTSASFNQKTETLQPEKRINPYGLPSQMFTGYERHSIETLCTLGRELVTELMNRMLFMLNQLKMNIKGGDIKQNKGMLQQQQHHVSNNIDAIRLQLEYSKLLFMALTEIRLRIDLKLTQELQDGQKLKDFRPSDDELLRMLSDSEQLISTTKRETGDEESDDNDDGPKDNVPMEQDNNLKQVELDPEIDAKKAEMATQFEKNRQQIIHLDCQLKKLEWLAMCSDPSMLNNRDSSGNAPMISQSKKRSDEVGSSNTGAGQASRRS